MHLDANVQRSERACHEKVCRPERRLSNQSRSPRIEHLLQPHPERHKARPRRAITTREACLALLACALLIAGVMLVLLGFEFLLSHLGSDGTYRPVGTLKPPLKTISLAPLHLGLLWWSCVDRPKCLGGPAIDDRRWPFSPPGGF